MSDKEATIVAIQKAVQEHAGWSSEVASRRLAERIYDAEPPRCDWDCDHCRDDEDDQPLPGTQPHDPHGFLDREGFLIIPPTGEEP